MNIRSKRLSCYLCGFRSIIKKREPAGSLFFINDYSNALFDQLRLKHAIQRLAGVQPFL